MYELVLLRHGQSEWNAENRFTGWADVNLSKQGKKEAEKAGQLLKKKSFTFDLAFTSLLKRAIKTLNIVLEEMDLLWIPILKSWQINEKHYGILQGLEKEKTKLKYGKDQVQQWRRSYNISPPALKINDKRNPKNDIKYKNLKNIPLTENLKITSERITSYWNQIITPEIIKGKKILIVAHGNSLRALIKYIDNISNAEIINVNIPTASPLIYNLDEKLKPINSFYLKENL